jgi:ribonucleoside-diphosphate reductase alpha chain
VGDDEWGDVGDWVYSLQLNINGLSFLPRDNHSYVQAPYEEVSEEVSVNDKKIDFGDFFEFEDDTTGSQELACAGGACLIG